MALKRLSFSFDSLMKELQLILSNVVIKRDYIAKQFENNAYKYEVDCFMTAMEGKSNYYTYNFFDNSVLKEVGYSDLEINNGLTKQDIKRDGRIDKCIELQDKLTINNYEESNNYYRKLNGLPNTGDNIFFYAPEEFYQANQIDFKPIHKFTINELKLLNKNDGYLDKLIEREAKDRILLDGSNMYVDRTYLKHLGANKIDIVKARQAKNYDLLFTNTDILNEFLHDEFAQTYETMRDYYSGYIYNGNISELIEGYDTFIGLMIMMRTINTLMIKTFKYSVERNYFDLRTMRIIYDAYNIPFNENLPLEYHKALLRNINFLLEYKASNRTILELFKIFNSEDMSLYRYYLVKQHMIYDGKPIFKYKKNYLGKTVPDTDKMYNFYFQLVDTRVNNIFATFKETGLQEPYSSVVSNDPYWIEDTMTKQKLVNSNFNYIESKYLGVAIMQHMSESIFENQFALRLIQDNKDDIIKFKVSISKLTEEIDLFLCVCCLCHLLAKKYGFKGNILIEPSKIYKVYGWNIKEDIYKLLEELKQTQFYDKKLDKLFKSIEINSEEDINKLFSDIMEFRKFINDKMFFASTIEEYNTYEKIYRVMLITEESNNNFELSTGEVATTYYEYIKDQNKELAIILDEVDDNNITEWIDAFINGMVDVLNSMKFAYNMNEGNDVIIECIINLVLFFKSYTADIIKYNTNLKVNDRTNRIKFLDDIHDIEVDLKMKSLIRGSFDSVIFEDKITLRDELGYIEQVKFIYDE